MSRRLDRGLGLALGAALTLGLGLAAAPAARADTSQSSNWAGYAVHRSGVQFDQVTGSWIQPSATCTSGTPTYSSLWVGLGGYSESSQALEQIGTELDCTASGQMRSSGWFELVPAPSHTLRLTIAPGDHVRAEVSVSGRDVTLRLTDETTHRSVTTTRRVSRLDLGSAEWIVEAPSLCAGTNDCETLPLADFGSAAFTAASARTANRISGPIDDRHWSTTKIVLAETGRRFIAGWGPPEAGAVATADPSALRAGGRAFAVTYAGAVGESALVTGARRMTRRPGPAAATTTTIMR